MSVAKVELGRHLFYDRRLSGSGRFACASCHRPELAFSDGRARAVGAAGDSHPRSSMTLTNVVYNASFGWTDPGLRSLEAQAAVPLFNDEPVELGVAGAEARVLSRLRAARDYARRFSDSFPGEAGPISLANVRRALAAFERTLLSGGSAYDRLVYQDDRGALGAKARDGMRLFFSERVGCARCHGGFNFALPVAYRHDPSPIPRFENNGLAMFSGDAIPAPSDRGVWTHTRAAVDRGRFRIPTLRNVAVTAPYMHDGRLATLAEVLNHYARGGHNSPTRSSRVETLALGSAERAAIVAFLESLTDTRFLADPRHADPFANSSERGSEAATDRR
jgi:cytochrome c peroxidase